MGVHIYNKNLVIKETKTFHFNFDLPKYVHKN